MPTRYDSSVIQTFADRLYRQADQIVYTYGLAGFILGAGVGAALSFGGHSRDSPLVPALFVGIVFCAFFVAAGRARSFTLRLQAQMALCQAQIERNTSAGGR
jgi:hypothetical protein